MKKLLVIVCLSAFFSTGCVYDATKTGVTESYGGLKTILTDASGLLGKVLEGGSVTIGAKGDAAYNNEEEK